jgi:glyoxylase-like metal-dependent hydrolase (beta-lactamase superfamily II)
MKIISNQGGVFATNAFLVADEIARQAVIFDAPDHTTGPLLDEAQKNGWDVIGLWLTHGHIDHIADHAAVSARFPGAKVLIHQSDQLKLHHPNSMYPLPFKTEARTADGYLHDEQQLKIGSIDVTVMHTPGHSPGHVAFYLPVEKTLIGGDLIIMGAVGRTDFPDCSYPALQQSIRRIMRLPMDTYLLPGHGDPSTLRDEAEGNPYVQEAMRIGAGSRE